MKHGFPDERGLERLTYGLNTLKLLGQAHRHCVQLDIHGPLKAEQLEYSWKITAANHHIHKAASCRSDGQFHLKKMNEEPCIEVFSGEGLNHSQLDAAIQDYVRQHTVTVGEGWYPLVILGLIRLSSENHILLWLQHPVILDLSWLPSLCQELFGRCQPAGEKKQGSPVFLSLPNKNSSRVVAQSTVEHSGVDRSEMCATLAAIFAAVAGLGKEFEPCAFWSSVQLSPPALWTFRLKQI